VALAARPYVSSTVPRILGNHLNTCSCRLVSELSAAVRHWRHPDRTAPRASTSPDLQDHSTSTLRNHQPSAWHGNARVAPWNVFDGTSGGQSACASSEYIKQHALEHFGDDGVLHVGR